MNSISSEEVIKIIEKYLGNRELSQEDMEQPLLTLEIDSFGRLELALNLEQELHVSIPDEVIWNRNITVLKFVEAVQGCFKRNSI